MIRIWQGNAGEAVEITEYVTRATLTEDIEEGAGVYGVCTANMLELSIKDNLNVANLADGTRISLTDTIGSIGEFYIINYNSKQDTYQDTINVTAVDALYKVLNTTTTTKTVHMGQSLHTYIIDTLTTNGHIRAENITIDIPNTTIDYTVAREDSTTLADTLLDICVFADCFIYVGRDNKVHVTSKVRADKLDKPTITSADLVSLKLSRLQRKGYSVKYIDTVKSEVVDLLQIDKEIAQGTTTYKDYKLDRPNVYDIDTVRVNSETGVYVDSVEVSSTHLKNLVVVNNSTTPQKATITVRGRTIESKEVEVVTEGETSTTVVSALIQTREKAEEVLARYTGREVGEIIQIEYIGKNVRGLALLDVVRVQETVKNKIDKAMFVTSLETNISATDGVYVTATLAEVGK